MEIKEYKHREEGREEKCPGVRCGFRRDRAIRGGGYFTETQQMPKVSDQAPQAREKEELAGTGKKVFIGEKDILGHIFREEKETFRGRHVGAEQRGNFFDGQMSSTSKW